MNGQFEDSERFKAPLDNVVEVCQCWAVPPHVTLICSELWRFLLRKFLFFYLFFLGKFLNELVETCSLCSLSQLWLFVNGIYSVFKSLPKWMIFYNRFGNEYNRLSRTEPWLNIEKALKNGWNQLQNCTKEMRAYVDLQRQKWFWKTLRRSEHLAGIHNNSMSERNLSLDSMCTAVLFYIDYIMLHKVANAFLKSFNLCEREKDKDTERESMCKGRAGGSGETQPHLVRCPKRWIPGPWTLAWAEGFSSCTIKDGLPVSPFMLIMQTLASSLPLHLYKHWSHTYLSTTQNALIFCVFLDVPRLWSWILSPSLSECLSTYFLVNLPPFDWYRNTAYWFSTFWSEDMYDQEQCILGR